MPGQMDYAIRDLKREIAQLEDDNLELQHDLEKVNARLELMIAVAEQLANELAARA